MFESFIDVGVVGRYFDGVNAEIECLYLGDFSPKSFKGADGAPYGGGPGMVMRADVLEGAIKKVFSNYSDPSNLEVIYTAPRGEELTNKMSRKLASDFTAAKGKDFVFICGRYEGIDERFIEQYVTRIISIGDFVLSGGELAVMTIIDSFSRFIDGVLGNSESFEDDSFEEGLIEGPSYTRPEIFNGVKVPDVLLSGNHKLINEYRVKKKLEFTKKLRPDLYALYENNRGKK
ncbi:tRNA (guanine(37)-N(1))-methyltransferase [Bacteriovorax sp. Seq25_V]|nr:tRNA (guanine(37)-N(1))-methyltransferase [Bacteriovorax sp. Seq25_V]